MHCFERWRTSHQWGGLQGAIDEPHCINCYEGSMSYMVESLIAARGANVCRRAMDDWPDVSYWIENLFGLSLHRKYLSLGGILGIIILWSLVAPRHISR